jgi:hypothetical protein
MLAELKERLQSTIALLLCNSPTAEAHPDPMFMAASMIITAENDPGHFPTIKEFVFGAYNSLAEAYTNNDKDCVVQVHVSSDIALQAEVAFLMNMLKDVYKSFPENEKEQYTWEQLRNFVEEESPHNEP